MTAYRATRPPRSAVITLLALFVAGNVLTALAPAFNLGNAIGAGLGGLAIGLGLGWRSPVYIGLAMVLLGTVLTFITSHGDD